MASKRYTVLSFGVSALVLVASSAMAQDATAVAERLKSTLATQGADIGWASVSGSGGQVVLEGVTAGLTGVPDKVNIGTITLDGVTDENGGYRVGTTTFPEYTIAEGDMGFEMKGTTITGLKLPAEGSTDPLAAMLFYDTADVASINVKAGGAQVFALEGARSAMTPPNGDAPLAFTFDVAKMSADLSTVPDPQAKAVIDGLGYQQLSGSIKSAGTWNPADGKMALTQNDIIVDNAGTLGLALDLSGYTPAFIKSLQDLQKKMAEAPQGGDNSAEGMAMLGLMQQLTFNSADIKFTDASLTNKVLDYVGAQQGMSGKDIANQAKAIVPFGMSQLNNPELTAQVTAAVSAFLDDPKSLTISAKPAAPVPFAVLAAGGMGDPTSLPKTLGVTVVAND